MKVALCGAGEMGNIHFDAFSRVEGVQVIAVADPDPARASALARGRARAYASSEEMIDSAGADIVSIAAPTHLHAPLALRALARGCHVFCEKPVARTVAEGESMARAAENAGRLLGFGYILRWNDAYRWARDAVAGGRIGRPGVVRTTRAKRQTAAWLSDLGKSGGAAFELLTHDLDWLQWSLGPVKRVFARGLAKGKSAVERDYCLAVVRFESGAIGHLEGSLAEADEAFATYEIAGDAGLISYDTRKSSVLEARLMTGDGLVHLSETPQNVRPFVRQVTAFVDAARAGRPFAVSTAEAMPALRLAAAVYDSIQSGSPVEP